MTARTDLVEIICDGPASGDGCPQDEARADYGTATSVRKKLHAVGWSVAQPGGIDRCKRCAK